MKAAIYLREPMDDENTGKRLIAKANEYGWEYEVYFDKTNKRKTRPAKSRLLKKLRNKEFEAVLIEALNTWANTSTELIREIAELSDKGMVFISVFEKLRFSGGFSDTQNQMLRAFNRFEQNMLNEKASLAIKRSKSRGINPGRPRGAKDKIKRKNDGYLVRESLKRQMKRVV
ncbi:MAG: recombinase family protein [Bacteroidales bacterium]|nr:recombinase family protein [Bacteroidales bacterium]